MQSSYGYGSSVHLITLTVLLIVFLPLSIAYAYDPTIMEKVKNFWHDISPPKDYYEPLLEEDFDISQKGLVKRFEYKHKYTRNYSAGILLKNFSRGDAFFPISSKKYKLKLKMEINFYVKNALVLTKFVENQYSQFLGEKGGGLTFIYYKCPDILPLDETIICEVKIIEPDNYLNETYGPTRFYIAKSSDK